MITYKQKPDTDESIFSILNPIVSRWFKNKFGKFSEPQKFSVIDIVNKKCLVDIIIEAEANEEIIDRLRLHLLPYEVRGMVVDGKGGLLRALKKEFSVPIQRCIMHVQKLIVQDYIKKYGKNLSLLQLRNMYMQLNILMNHDAEVQMLNRLLKEKIIEQDEIRKKEEERKGN